MQDVHAACFNFELLIYVKKKYRNLRITLLFAYYYQFACKLTKAKQIVLQY